MSDIICIHVYLQSCVTNSQPPGLADYLRGTISLTQYCRQYNFKLLINNSHPIFNYLEQNSTLFTSEKHGKVYEAIPGSSHGSYTSINNSLCKLFAKKESFSVLTNNFYYDSNNSFGNFSDLSTESKQILKSILVPNTELNTEIDNVYKYLGIDTSAKYTVIHIRCGDAFLHNDHYDDQLFKKYDTNIKDIVTIQKDPIILITDSSIMGNYIKTKYNSILYWDSLKIHLGDLKNIRSGVLDTLIDFFILTRSSAIYGTTGSGFSKAASVIFDIPYISM
jgi:hypothetical protein